MPVGARGGTGDAAPLRRRGIGTIVYSPLDRGRLAHSWGEATVRSDAEPDVATLKAATVESDQRIVEAVGTVAAERGVSRAQVALTWVRRNPMVASLIVGALDTRHIDDAVAAPSLTLPDEEAARLEAAYTPRRDRQGITDPAAMKRMIEAVGFKASAA